MIKNTVQLMNEAKTIVQSVSPVETGNLRDNAIRAYLTPTGFRIVMLYTAAFYGAILDTPGEKAPQMHAGWWSIKARGKVSTYIKSSLNNRKSMFEQSTTHIAKYASDDAAKQRRFYNSIVADVGRDKAFAVMQQLGRQ
jgi:hypothetical protein